MTDVVRTEAVLGGEPRLAGHRISVLQVTDMVLEADHSPEYVADQLGISLADVHGALSYYYDNPDEMAAVREKHEGLETALAAHATPPDGVEH